MNAIVRYEFFELCVRLARAKYLEGNEIEDGPSDICEALKALMNDNLLETFKKFYSQVNHKQNSIS
jgi:hypothetical protein